MIELLIVVAILGILLFLLIFTTFRQVSKGRDGKRKADLEKIKVAFEDYYNDNNCYPLPEDWVEYECDSADFKPYLNTIPCDPLTKELYLYIPSEDWVCNGYRMLAKLENADDPSVTGVGCDPTGGCGYAEDGAYNYGVAQGTTVYVGEGGGGGGYPGETPDYSDDWYCTATQGCAHLAYDTAEGWECPKIYEYAGAAPPEECVTECDPTHDAYDDVVCPGTIE